MVSSQQPPNFAAQSIVGNAGLAIGFVTTAHPSNQWTWTTRLGWLLHRAEALYGPRDKEWTILGIEFGGSIPMVWYPNDYPKAVAVRLSETMKASPASAFSELAHEVVHLLSPIGSASANNFEEGLATAFAEDQCAAMGVPPATQIASYAGAAAAVRRLLAILPNGVKSLRA